MIKKALTAAGVERLKIPKRGRVERYDGRLPGFGVRVTSNGHKSWIVLGQLNGQRVRCTLGAVGQYTLAEARTKAQTYIEEFKNGRDPRVLQKREKAKAKKEQANTFASVSDDFIERYAKKRANKSSAETKRLLDKHVRPSWGYRPLSEIHRDDVVELLDDIEDGHGFYTANRVLAATRKMFNWAVAERGLIGATPIVPGMSRGEEVKRKRTLTSEEIRTLWNIDAGYPFDPFTKLLFVTAQRLREVAGMRWSEVDLDEKHWVLPTERTKSKRAHIVPLSPLALEILETLPRFSGDFIFTTTAGERPISGFSKAKKRIDGLLKDLADGKPDEFSEVDSWRFHDLRRTAGTGMAKLGIPKEIRARVLNHANKGVTDEIYNEYDYLPEKCHALDAWASRLSNLIQPPSDKVIPLHNRVQE